MMHLNGKIPEQIGRLPELAYNLWWSWTAEARELFKRLDTTLWRSTQHNPVEMLRAISPERLDAVSHDASFIRLYNKVMMMLDRELENGHLWFSGTYPELHQETIAYFSAEFGLHNSLPIYSGGLGILSGDHAKEASDLAIPLAGVGFMYPQGYFRQRIPSHGWQEAIYEQLDMNDAPIRPAADASGNEVKISVRLGDRDVFARIWHVAVGRINLYLLDTDVDENDPWNRELSARLYSGDSEVRIRQEIMLGIGGVRTLRAMNVSPAAWHMNEGHSAFLVLELMREKVAAGLSFAEAREEVRERTVFTTHTPVAAGHDAFAFHLVEQYFNDFWPELGISREEFLSLGRHHETWGPAFNMTVLALRSAGRINGVSELHGEVSREMWQGVWPDRPVDEVPIIAITNGVHVPTWVPTETRMLFNKYLGANWVDDQDDPALWERLAEIPDAELWDVHLQLKHKLIAFLRERVRNRWVRGGDDPTGVLTSGTLLDPGTLTIGFARRFATYKRANLIFTDIERLRALVLDTHRPVQLIFAGKAHPADDPGKMLIQEIYTHAKHHELGGRVAFVEDYDMHMARYLVQGVDVWLNNPRRPREASGTSGMKAAINGIPNLSVLDGWWAEGYNGGNGWVIGDETVRDNEEEQNWADAVSLYEQLEREIVPLFYDRDRDNIPRGWLEVMRESIRSCAPRFGTRRMLKDYTTRLYVPAMTEEKAPVPAPER
jgi:glycogen phosphorylase